MVRAPFGFTPTRLATATLLTSLLATSSALTQPSQDPAAGVGDPTPDPVEEQILDPSEGSTDAATPDPVTEPGPDPAPLANTAVTEPADLPAEEDAERPDDEVATVTPDESDDADVDVGGPYRSFRGGIVIADARDDPDPRKQWQIAFGGYMRVQYRSIQDDPNIQFLGRNDGFVLTNIRPYFAGKTANGLGWRFQIEAAGRLPAASDIQPFQEKTVRPRDAFISYNPISYFNVQLGQFKPPHNLEELQPNADILFIDRSVANDGVSGFEGRNVAGLVLDREVGAQLTGQAYFTSEDNRPEGPGVAYALAVTNGSNAALTFNDNDSLAYYGRASLHWGKIVSLGGGAYLNDTTVINQQDNVDVLITGITGDLAVNVAGVKLLGALTQRREETNFLVDSLPAGTDVNFTVARGLVGQIGYLIPVVNIQPAYRFATYDPTVEYATLDPQSTEIREVDALTHHTLGLSYLPDSLPIQVMLNYTVTQEQQGREIANNHLEALIQATW